jgi:hypothetical protein
MNSAAPSPAKPVANMTRVAGSGTVAVTLAWASRGRAIPRTAIVNTTATSWIRFIASPLVQTVYLFFVSSPNVFRSSQACKAGRQQGQRGRLRNDSNGATGMGLKRQNHPAERQCKQPNYSFNPFHLNPSFASWITCFRQRTNLAVPRPMSPVANSANVAVFGLQMKIDMVCLIHQSHRKSNKYDSFQGTVLQ